MHHVSLLRQAQRVAISSMHSACNARIAVFQRVACNPSLLVQLSMETLSMQFHMQRKARAARGTHLHAVPVYTDKHP